MKLLRSPLLFTLLGLVLGLIAGAVVFLVSAAPRGEAVQLLPAHTPAPILVDVSGAVEKPGVYPLPRDSRVQDAIQAAGGMSGTANRAAVNLAARLKDGDRVVIPAVGTPAAPLSVQRAPGDSSEGGTSDAAPESSGPVNLNTATLQELETLPGIGPSKAQDIIAYREANGGFGAIEEIQNVKGIGPATYEKLKSRLTVE